MSLSELLRQAEVPKGCFYHYFPSKEAFGVVMLEHYYRDYNQALQQCLEQYPNQGRLAVYRWYQTRLAAFELSGLLGNCLGAKLSAEVCDLSADMRQALNRGAEDVVHQIADALAQDRSQDPALSPQGSEQCAQIIYALWLGASLQAKLTASLLPLQLALNHIHHLLKLPAAV